MKPVPELNKEYHIFDDGKIRPSRHYLAKIVEIIPFNECKDESLIEAWKENSKKSWWLFEIETDYFIKATSLYDENLLYFVRTQDGGWFSIDYPDIWMGTRLDIDGSLYKILLEQYGANYDEY